MSVASKRKTRLNAFTTRVYTANVYLSFSLSAPNIIRVRRKTLSLPPPPLSPTLHLSPPLSLSRPLSRCGKRKKSRKNGFQTPFGRFENFVFPKSSTGLCSTCIFITTTGNANDGHKRVERFVTKRFGGIFQFIFILSPTQ